MEKSTEKLAETQKALESNILDFEKSIFTLRRSDSQLRDDVLELKTNITTIATRQLKSRQ